MICATHSKTQIVANTIFGKNRVQVDLFDWRFVDADKFTFQFYDSLHANYVTEIVKMCNEELTNLQIEMDYEIPKHFNFLFYYSYEQYLQSNAGLQLDWYNTNELARLVNNKIVLYYSFKTEDIRKQIRQGIVRLILEYTLLGNEQGEINQEESIGGFPKWFLYGLISYKAETWNADLDYELKVIVEEDKYKKFRHFIADNSMLAGQTFWYYVETRFGLNKIENLVNYLRYEKNMQTICLKLFKSTYKDFVSNIFDFFKSHYKKDNVKRKDNIKGQTYTTTTFTKENIITVQANPNLKKGIYGIVEFNAGIYKVFVSKTRAKRKQILKTGLHIYNAKPSQTYPLIAWREDGLRLGVMYYDKTFLHFFEYDVIENTRKTEINLSLYFTLIQDFKYIDKGQKLLISGIKNGQSDVMIFDLENKEIEQITNDIYDDIDPAYVTFPGKVGIMFSSNRPSYAYVNGEEKILNNSLKKESLKICIADYSAPKNFHNISVLTHNAFGNARYPSTFTPTTFSYLSDENGIKNRYVGKYSMRRKGLDSVYKIAGTYYVNLVKKEVDSILKFHNIKQSEKIYYAVKTHDTSTNMPFTNYSRSIIESKTVSGISPLVTDLKYTKQSKILYKSNIIDNDIEGLNTRSLVNTFFIKSKLTKPSLLATLSDQYANTKSIDNIYADSITYYKNYFLSEFQFNPLIYSDTLKPQASTSIVGIEKAINLVNYFNPIHKKYKFKFFTFDFDYDILNNDLMGEKYQAYQGGIGPIKLSNNSVFNNMMKIKVMDILEDINLTIGYRFPFNFTNPISDFIADINFLKYRLDYGFTYFRNVQSGYNDGKIISNFYSFNMSYPFNILRRLKLNLGLRRDYFNYKYKDIGDAVKLGQNDSITWNSVFKLEYVYDNTISPTLNISKGFKYKIYSEYFFNITKHNVSTSPNIDVLSLDKNTFNIGADFRIYTPIYKNIIWANRFACDFSFGNNLLIYYLGGTDGWLNPSFENSNLPNTKYNYNYQSLALNLRGYKQNISNGSKNIVINSEVRAPILSSILRRPITNAILRNFQLVSFIDIGMAWNNFEDIKPTTQTFANEQVSVVIQTSKYPFAAGYGFGARLNINSYYFRLDRAYPITSFFKNGVYYFSLGLDF